MYKKIPVRYITNSLIENIVETVKNHDTDIQSNTLDALIYLKDRFNHQGTIIKTIKLYAAHPNKYVASKTSEFISIFN